VFERERVMWSCLVIERMKVVGVGG